MPKKCGYLRGSLSHDSAENTLLFLVRALFFAVLFSVLNTPARAAETSPAILAYHRFGPEVTDSMTVRTETFLAQLKYLREHAYTIVSLQQAVNAWQGKAQLPTKSVVITIDDGHRSVYSELLPIVQREKIPVTLFIYPSAISNASYAMRWEQLKELQATGLFDIQSHTYWHPNFKIEKKRLTPEAYQAFVRKQLEASRKTLKSRLGVDAIFLAWPFGIYDEELMSVARQTGYVAALSIDGRPLRQNDSAFGLPRFLMQDPQGVKGFANLLNETKK